MTKRRPVFGTFASNEAHSIVSKPISAAQIADEWISSARQG